MDNPQVKVVEVESDEPGLGDIDAMDDSVLGSALRRVTRSATDEREGISAHNSTQHNSSHSSTPW